MLARALRAWTFYQENNVGQKFKLFKSDFWVISIIITQQPKKETPTLRPTDPRFLIGATCLQVTTIISDVTTPQRHLFPSTLCCRANTSVLNSSLPRLDVFTLACTTEHQHQVQPRRWCSWYKVRLDRRADPLVCSSLWSWGLRVHTRLCLCGRWIHGWIHLHNCAVRLSFTQAQIMSESIVQSPFFTLKNNLPLK